MNQLQEISILFRKRMAQLKKKKQRCLDYSSTPNRCAAKVDAQIKRLRGIEIASRFRKRTLEANTLIDQYLNVLQEKLRQPSSPAAKVVKYGLAGLAVYKGAKWAIKRDQCKQYKYSPYLYKRCMKGLDEEE